MAKLSPKRKPDRAEQFWEGEAHMVATGCHAGQVSQRKQKEVMVCLGGHGNDQTNHHSRPPAVFSSDAARPDFFSSE